MIKDQTLDEAIIEIARTLKALKKLRAKRKAEFFDHAGRPYMTPPHHLVSIEHAAAKRASMDLTRKLADLRQGR